MKLKFLFMFIFLLFSFNLFAFKSIEQHDPTYFAFGDKINQVKYQVSFKYDLWYPYNTGLYLSYTQIAHWNLYDQSSPFMGINHSPAVFWEKRNIKCFDFIRFSPITHLSNGLAGQESRSVDRIYIEAQISKGQVINVGIREKIQYFYKKTMSRHNRDYKRFVGNFETEIFAQIKSQKGFLGHERISIKGEWTNKFYWFAAEASCRILTTKFRPHLYVQYYRGYAEFLLDYNKKTEALRAGFIFTD